MSLKDARKRAHTQAPNGKITKGPAAPLGREGAQSTSTRICEALLAQMGRPCRVNPCHPIATTAEFLPCCLGQVHRSHLGARIQSRKLGGQHR